MEWTTANPGLIQSKIFIENFSCRLNCYKLSFSSICEQISWKRIPVDRYRVDVF